MHQQQTFIQWIKYTKHVGVICSHSLGEQIYIIKLSPRLIYCLHISYYLCLKLPFSSFLSSATVWKPKWVVSGAPSFNELWRELWEKALSKPQQEELYSLPQSCSDKSLQAFLSFHNLWHDKERPNMVQCSYICAIIIAYSVFPWLGRS